MAATPPATTNGGMVSVLFADLVGFTALAGARDPEEVRELLTGYFEAARDAVERHGGTVEKFIGDAVMAVWGAPIAQEDDAERAVRVALELVDAVHALGERTGIELERASGGRDRRGGGDDRARSARASWPATSSTPRRASRQPRRRGPCSSMTPPGG